MNQQNSQQNSHEGYGNEQNLRPSRQNTTQINWNECMYLLAFVWVIKKVT